MAHNQNIQNEMISFFIKGNNNNNILININKIFTQHFFFFRFVLIGRNATYTTDNSKLRSKLIQQASFPESTATVITLPSIKNASINIYEQYVKRATVCKKIMIYII